MKHLLIALSLVFVTLTGFSQVNCNIPDFKLKAYPAAITASFTWPEGATQSQPGILEPYVKSPCAELNPYNPFTLSAWHGITYNTHYKITVMFRTADNKYLCSQTDTVTTLPYVGATAPAPIPVEGIVSCKCPNDKPYRMCGAGPPVCVSKKARNQYIKLNYFPCPCP